MYQKLIIAGNLGRADFDGVADTNKVYQRFISKVQIDNPTGCWEWTSTKARGYGILNYKHGSSPLRAHRLSYALFIGDIPEGYEVCHFCDNPGCVNPKHLFLGTHKDNMHDAALKNRTNHPNTEPGENNPAAKLSNVQVKQLREEFANGAFISELAQKYNCTNITRILRNQAYCDPEFTPINGNKKPRNYRKVVSKQMQDFILKSNDSACKLSKILPYSKPTILKIRKGAY